MEFFEQYFNLGNLKNERVKPCFIVAEIAQAHDGSLGLAHSYIDAVADAGADAVKFQTHIADAESTINDEFRVDIFPQDKNRYEYWKRMEFTYEQWCELAKHANDKNLVFLSSPFSLEAVDLLNRIGVKGWKIGSGEFFNDQLLNKIISTKKPLLLSTGMSLLEEIDKIVNILKTKKTSFALMQCTSKYPTDLSEVGLNVMHEYKNKYNCPSGLSDHSGTIFAGLAAMAQGANFLEVHVTFDKKMFGPDISSSITFNELDLICKSRDAFNILENSKTNKNEISKQLLNTKNLFTKSLAFKENQIKNTIIENSMLTLKKPGTGIQFNDKGKILGKKLINDKSANEIIKWEDLK